MLTGEAPFDEQGPALLLSQIDRDLFGADDDSCVRSSVGGSAESESSFRQFQSDSSPSAASESEQQQSTRRSSSNRSSHAFWCEEEGAVGTPTNSSGSVCSSSVRVEEVQDGRSSYRSSSSRRHTRSDSLDSSDNVGGASDYSAPDKSSTVPDKSSTVPDDDSTAHDESST